MVGRRRIIHYGGIRARGNEYFSVVIEKAERVEYNKPDIAHNGGTYEHFRKIHLCPLRA